MMDHEKLGKSLRHLQRQLANLATVSARTELTELDREAIAESVIQRFAICYDTLWKGLRRHMTEELGLPDVPVSPKPLFRLAGRNDLLPSSVEQWLRYADARIGTTHDYSGGKALDTLMLAEPFWRDAVGLYQTLTGKAWQ
ncbi:MAG: nucleotidyltransferase substrate binding protein [Magnetococcales bacterium]|nr:nucleotidyltransferase substrate binding protein [Magnetococcales bacterium]